MSAFSLLTGENRKRKKTPTCRIGRRRRRGQKRAIEKMKPVWCPERGALIAYIDTVKFCNLHHIESSVAELVSAIAAGWNAQFIVETWSSSSGDTETSIGLEIARTNTSGRHLCIVPDEKSRLEYVRAMQEKTRISTEVIVGQPAEIMEGLTEIDFMVVDCRVKDFDRTLRLASLRQRGAVLVRKNVACSENNMGFKWQSAVGESHHVVRSVLLPVGRGLDIAYVVAGRGISGLRKGEGRWTRYVDRYSGEENIIRK